MYNVGVVRQLLHFLFLEHEQEQGDRKVLDLEEVHSLRVRNQLGLVLILGGRVRQGGERVVVLCRVRTGGEGVVEEEEVVRGE